MIFNRTEKEEKAYLMDIIALLAANIEQMDKAIEDKSKDVMEHKLYLWENLSELDREKETLSQNDGHPLFRSHRLSRKRATRSPAIIYRYTLIFQSSHQ